MTKFKEPRKLILTKIEEDEELMFSSRVCKTVVSEGIEVSTIRVTPPYGNYFETMIFGGKFDQKGERSNTEFQAGKAHQRAIKRIERGGD